MHILTDKEIVLQVSGGETVTLKTPSGDVIINVEAHTTSIQAQGVSKIGQPLYHGTLMLRGEV